MHSFIHALLFVFGVGTMVSMYHVLRCRSRQQAWVEVLLDDGATVFLSINPFDTTWSVLTAAPASCHTSWFQLETLHKTIHPLPPPQAQAAPAQVPTGTGAGMWGPGCDDEARGRSPEVTGGGGGSAPPSQGAVQVAAIRPGAGQVGVGVCKRRPLLQKCEGHCGC